MRRLIARQWMLLAAVLVVAVAGSCVYRPHGIFGSNHNKATPNGFANEIVPSGTVATINYHR